MSSMEPIADTRGSDQVIERWLERRGKFTKDEVGELVKLAQQSGGELVNVSAFGGERDPDDWCGTMWFRKPRPRIGALVDQLVDRGWGVEIFPRGIINPDMVEIVVQNQVRR
jgi:hypothetical protein